MSKQYNAAGALQQPMNSLKISDLAPVLAQAIKNRAPILLVGAPGIGKTDSLEQAAATAGADLLVAHPVVSDPTDAKGFPVDKGDHAEFIPYGDLWILMNAQKLTVFIIDDLGQAPQTVQAAYMQLLLKREINGKRISDNVVIFAATNRKEDRAGVSGLIEALKSRFVTILNIIPDVDDWTAWALANNQPTDLIAFIRFRPNMLHDFTPSPEIKNYPCPRTVANVGKIYRDWDLTPEQFQAVIAGAAGEGFAAEFRGFLEIKKELPSLDRILLDPAAAPVPTKPAALYAVTTALARKADPGNFDRILQYMDRTAPEYQVLAVRDAIQQYPELTDTRTYIDWSVKNQHVFTAAAA